jgi:hypothetical protein
VPLDRYKHNRWFLNTDHVRDLWLPHLWDIVPHDYLVFINLCKKAANALKSREWGPYNVAELELRETKWSFSTRDAESKNIGSYIADDLQVALPDRANSPEAAQALSCEIERRVIPAMVLEVAKACIEFEKPSNRKWDVIQWSLNPRRAISKAVDHQIQTYLSARSQR